MSETQNLRGGALGGVDRRAFLTRGLAFVAAGSLMPAAFVRGVFAEELPDAQTLSGRRVLVVVQLGGGNDGLNTVIPYADGAYFDARGELAVNPESVIALDDRVALHPYLAGFGELYERGSLAIIEGVGYSDPNRSHFRAMDIWNTASPRADVTEASTGWLGRLLDASAGDHDSRWRSANVGAVAPLALGADDTFVPSLESMPAYVLQSDQRLSEAGAARRTTDWMQIYAQQAAAGGRLAMLSRTGLDAYQSTIELGDDVSDYVALADYPTSPLGSALFTCAQLIGSNLGTTVLYVTTGGFVSHAAQARTQPELLRGLSEAMLAFQNDLDAHGTGADVTTFVWTEFGRRVRANGSAGTDHGAAGPAFVVGGSVLGGLHGEPSPLGDLDDNGNLRYTTDFRSIYASLAEQWLGVDRRGIVGDEFAPLTLFRS